MRINEIPTPVSPEVARQAKEDALEYLGDLSKLDDSMVGQMIIACIFNLCERWKVKPSTFLKGFGGAIVQMEKEIIEEHLDNQRGD